MTTRVTLPAPTATALPRGMRLPRWTWLLALALASAGYAWWHDGRVAESARTAPTGPDSGSDARLVPDDAGTITDWLLSLPESHQPFFLPAQADLVAAAPDAITFRLLYSSARSRAAMEALLAERGVRGKRVQWLQSRESLSPWTRDYLLFAWEGGGVHALLHRAEHYQHAHGVWSSRDPWVFANAFSDTPARHTGLRVEGGEVVVGSERAFASRSGLDSALRHADVDGEAAGTEAAHATWGLPVTWIDHAGIDSSDHCDLYLMPAGGRRIVLGSPTMAARLLESAPAHESASLGVAMREHARRAQAPNPPLLDAGADPVRELVSQTTRPPRLAAFERLRAQLVGLGYEVVPIPFLALDPREGGLRLTLSYTNVVQDHRDGIATVYLPSYGCPPLDRAARQTWTGMGYRVVPTGALGPAMHGGSIRCLSLVRKLR